MATDNRSQVSGKSIVAGAVLTMLLGIWFTATDDGEGLRRLSYDLLFLRRAAETPEDIVIIYMDEDAHESLNQPGDRIWNRQIHARLLDRMTEEGARAVFFDLIFDVPSSDLEADNALADAIKRNGRVILGGKRREVDEEGVPIVRIIPPISEFRQHALTWGLLEVDDYPDNAVRRISTGDDTVPSATWKMAAVLDGLAENETGRVQENRWRQLGAAFEAQAGPINASRWLQYLGPPDVFTSYSYNRALSLDDVPPGTFAGKIVFVGSGKTVGFTGSQKDSFRSPYSMSGFSKYQGVDVHATTFANLRSGEWFTPIPRGFEVFLAAAYGIIIALIMCLLHPRLSAPFALVCVVGIIAVSVWLCWQEMILFNWMVAASIQTPVAFVWALGAFYLAELKRRSRLSGAIDAYLSPQVAKRMLRGNEEVKVGGEVREMLILFTDLQGFTNLLDSADPEEMCEVFRKYYNLIINQIFIHDGTVVKILGDATLAVWGAPLEDPRRADHAAEAALGVLSDTGAFKIYGHRLTTRLGLNIGPALVGNFGSDQRFDFTVIGDHVNEAARLESLNKQLGTHILISESVERELSSQFVTRFAGALRLVGKDVPTRVYELLGKEDDPGVLGAKKWLDPFNDGLERFEKGRFDDAEEAFQTAAQIRGADGVSAFYLDQIAALRATPPDLETWTGEVIMEKK